MPSDELKVYRQVQKLICIERDSGLCTRCFFVDDKKRTKAVDVHHVLGRGRKVGSGLEHYTNLLSLCRPCHEKYEHRTASRNEELAVLTLANERPINVEFEHK